MRDRLLYRLRQLVFSRFGVYALVAAALVWWLG